MQTETDTIRLPAVRRRVLRAIVAMDDAAERVNLSRVARRLRRSPQYIQAEARRLAARGLLWQDVEQRTYGPTTAGRELAGML